jgi:hypothetical protein
MNTESLACPYCNALISAVAGANLGQRIPCPRCGEAFTLRKPTPARSSDLQEAPSAAFSAPVGVELSVERRLCMARSNRILATAVLGVMGVVAAIGLAFALYTTGDRRAHDTRMPPPHRSPLAEQPLDVQPAAPPATLEALRWLPGDTTLIAGVQVAELRQTDAGRDLLNHLFHIGKIEINADMLERWTGLKMDDVDHVVLGVQADDALPPQTVLIVRTSRPYDADAVKTALHAEQAGGAGNKTFYKGKPADGGLRPVLWFANDRTMVIGLLERHLEAVPDAPAAGLERLPAEMRTLLEERLQSAGPAWMVASSPDWRKTGAALLIGALSQSDADLLGHVHGLAFQLQADKPLKFLASVQCEDEKTVEALETRLTAVKPAAVTDWKTARDGSWLLLQVRGDPAAFFKGGAP